MQLIESISFLDSCIFIMKITPSIRAASVNMGQNLFSNDSFMLKIAIFVKHEKSSF